MSLEKHTSIDLSTSADKLVSVGKPASVVVCHRHGCRFPSNSYMNSNILPNDTNFLNVQGMGLTLQGCNKLKRLGKDLAKTYGYLGEPIVLTTNTQRTLLSAESLLSGYYKSIGKIYAPYRITTLTHENRYPANVYIDSLSILFNRSDDKLSNWRNNNLEYHTRYLDDPDLVDLLDLCYTITGIPDPTLPLWKRLSQITSHLTIVRYCKDNNIYPLDNTLDIRLTLDEIDKLCNYAQMVYICGHIPLPGQYNLCIDYAKRILSDIYEYLGHNTGIQIYSCHDTTILSILFALNVISGSPDFGGYIIFEYYSDGRLSFKYNPDSNHIGILVSKVLPDTYTEFDKLDDGFNTLDSILI